MLDVRTAQTQLEDVLLDTVVYGLGARWTPAADAAALRAMATLGDSKTSKMTEIDLAVMMAPALTSFRWFPASLEADNGTTIIRPNDLPATVPGRWKQWTSVLRRSATVGGNSFTLDQQTTGPLRRVLILDKPHTEEEINSLIAGDVPAVVIVATGDDPEDLAQSGGRWNTVFHFEVSTVVQNLRADRQAAQGPDVSSDTDPGGNGIDGELQALLLGTVLNAVEGGIREIKPGPGRNWTSNYGQRRIIRSRVFNIYATVQFPNAPNELGPAEGVNLQAQMAQPNVAGDEFDTANFLQAGGGVVTGAGLVQGIAAAAGFIGGVAVAYAGELGHVFAPYSDTYRDLKPDGTMAFVVVGAGSEPPGVTSGALRIGVTTTTGFNVVSDAILAATKSDYGPVWDIPLT